MKPIALIAMLSLAALVSCGRGITVPPPNAEPSPPVPPAELSTIRLPVTVDLGSAIAQAESAVPRTFRAGDWMVVDRNAVGDFGIRFEATRDPLRLEARGNRLVAGSRVRYWVEAAQRIPRPLVGGSFWQELGSCGRGEPLREVEVGLETVVGHNGSWQLTSKTTVREPMFTNQCRMTFLKVNVTDRVAGAFEQALAKAATTVDQTIARQGNLRSIAERAWSQLQAPIALDSGFTLSLAPIGAGLLSLDGSGRTVTAVVGITARPTVTYGTPAPARSPLGSLGASALPDGFRVTVDGELSFVELNRQLRSRLAGTTHDVQGHRVTVNAAEAYGSGSRIVLRLDLSGDVDGTIYLVGTPRYEPASGLLSLADIDYSLETRRALLNVADWLYHESFRSSIARQARWGLEHGIAQVRARLEKALNRELSPGVRSVATVGVVRPVGVFVTPAALRARVVVDGTMRIEIR